jgi:hypothetical protein
MQERLFREARSAGRLIHQGIVLIFDVGLHEDSAFITMELVDGPSLQQRLAEGPLDAKAALGILQQTAAALDFAHENGVVHRDIKPANIMLQNKVKVKVADFGIAKLMSQNATLTGTLMGTPSYMSPEQIEAQPVDGRSDQFSLAVLAYELFTGSRPFVADSMPTVAHLIVYGPRPSAHAVNPLVPEAVDHVLERALSRFPNQRFANCCEFAAALETALRSAPPLKIKAPAASPKKTRSPMIYVAGLAALIVVALALAFVRFKGSPPAVHATAPSVAPAPVPVVPAKPTPFVEPQTPPPAVEKAALVIPPSPEPPPPAPSQPKLDPNARVPTAFRAQEIYRAAIAKRDKGKPEEAFGLFKESAELDNAAAMRELGESYHSGDGVAKDVTAAEQWLLKAAVKGDALAEVWLGVMYYLGDDIPANYEQAAKLFQQAADQKNPAGMFDLAKMYEEGRGVTRNVDTAKQLYQSAAALGSAEAQHRLAELLGRR